MYPYGGERIHRSIKDFVKREEKRKLKN